jgi:hypothetical protein
VDVKKLVAERLPVEDLTRGIELMKAGKAGMKLQVIWD